MVIGIRIVLWVLMWGIGISARKLTSMAFWIALHYEFLNTNVVEAAKRKLGLADIGDVLFNALGEYIFSALLECVTQTDRQWRCCQILLSSTKQIQFV